MESAGAAHELDPLEVSPSPFRRAFDRARSEALQGAGGPLAVGQRPAVERTRFEYHLEKRRGKRSADEANWNALGGQGWELVGVTRQARGLQAPRRLRLQPLTRSGAP